jgi:hypothetical protein
MHYGVCHRERIVVAMGGGRRAWRSRLGRATHGDAAGKGGLGRRGGWLGGARAGRCPLRAGSAGPSGQAGKAIHRPATSNLPPPPLMDQVRIKVSTLDRRQS